MIRILSLLLIPLASPAGASGNRAEQAVAEKARQELEWMGVAYSEASFIEAVKSGDKRIVRMFLKAGMSPDAKDAAGRTAVMCAVEEGHAEIAELLLGAGARGVPEKEVILRRAAETRRLMKRLEESNRGINAESLRYFCQQGDPELVRFLVQRGVPADGRDERHGRTPLMWAVDYGRRDAVEVLLEAGADVNAAGRGNETALSLAAGAADVDGRIVEALVRAGADGAGEALLDSVRRGGSPAALALVRAGAGLNARDPGAGWTPLMFAVARCDARIADALIAAGAEVNTRDINGLTPLAIAIGRSRQDSYCLDIVNRLIQADADVNAALHDGVSVLMMAVGNRDTEIVRALVRAGADVGARDSLGRSAPMLADSLGHAEIAGMLRGASPGGKPDPLAEKAGADSIALLEAVRLGKTEAVRSLISEGVKKESLDAALLGACSMGQADIADLLIGAGADADKEYPGGMTLLMAAAARGHAGVVLSLVRAGARMEAKHPAGTALSIAASEGRAEVVAVLIEAGADVEGRSADSTALRCAVKRGHADIVRMLAAAGANVNEKFYAGTTPLMDAAYLGHEEVARALIGAGADVSARNNAGLTALDWARHGNRPNLEKIIGDGL